MQKLFLPELPMHLSSSSNHKVLMIDDDQIYFEDITPLYEFIHESPNDISLLCAPDKFNLRKICRGKRAGPVTHNCHDELYCVTGLMGFPIRHPESRSALIQTLERTSHDMMLEYPNFVDKQAGQDVFNRFFRFHYQTSGNATSPSVQVIPCEWSCGTDECGKILGRMGCRNCDVSKCKAFHYQVKSFLESQKQQKAEWSWEYYEMDDSLYLLENTYIPRVKGLCMKKSIQKDVSIKERLR